MKTPRIALITEPDHPGLRPDDLCLVDAFAALGARAEPVAWGREILAADFDGAVVRTPWDYFEKIGSFLGWVDSLPVPLLNSPAVIHWNHHKSYLAELQDLGLARLPRTVMIGANERPSDGAAVLSAVGAERAVLKPAVSGGAFRTFVVTGDDEIHWDHGAEGEYLAQAFVDAIEGDGPGQGEWSLVFFGGDYSHGLRKVATSGDFRVQEEHGGRVLFESPCAELIDAATRVLAGTVRHLGLSAALAYARVDMVATDEGDPLLMELELIEPELFFRVDPTSPLRYAKAVLAAL